MEARSSAFFFFFLLLWKPVSGDFNEAQVV